MKAICEFGDAAHSELVWTHPGMSTYYRNRHGRVVSPSPFRLVDTWAMTHRPDLNAFTLVAAYNQQTSRRTDS